MRGKAKEGDRDGERNYAPLLLSIIWESNASPPSSPASGIRQEGFWERSTGICREMRADARTKGRNGAREDAREETN